MLHVDDDMDALFRKAAAQYQLNTTGANFDKVASKLRNENTDRATIMPTEKKGNRRYLLLLLLLPLGWICNDVYRNMLAPQVSNGEHNFNAKAYVSLKQKKAQAVLEQKNNTAEISNQQRAQSSLSSSNAIVSPNSKVIATGSRSTENIYPNTIQRRKNVVVMDEDMAATSANYFGGTTPLEQALPTITPSNQSDVQQPGAAPMRRTVELEEVVFKEKIADPPMVQKIADTSASVAGKTVGASPKKQASITHKLYVGIIGGFDVSTVKYQQINDHGFNAGLLVGYKIKKRWSAEVLVMFDQKAYYTNARYFDNSKAYLPYFSALKTIQGDCSMIELALNGKYNLTTSEKKRWFTTAGLSSYFMSSENYDYTYVYANGSAYSKTASYSNKSNHWFSIINLAIGYEHAVASKTMLRIEPYIKLPIAGVGIGKLPISSSGVNIAVTRNF